MAPGDYVEELVSSGETRRYRLHIPPTYRPGAALPLVINLHGLNSNAAQQERLSGMSRKADAAGFVAVYPEGLGDPQTWHFGPEQGGAADLQFLRDLIGRMQQWLGVDPARVYMTGISNGAQMANRAGCELADLNQPPSATSTRAICLAPRTKSSMRIFSSGAWARAPG